MTSDLDILALYSNTDTSWVKNEAQHQRSKFIARGGKYKSDRCNRVMQYGLSSFENARDH